MSETLLTTAEVAAMLRLSVDEFRKLRYRGGGPPAVKVGERTLRWRECDVQRWIDEHLESR